MQITSSAEAGALVKSLRESRKLSRKELSDASGIPLRTVYAVEKGELNNLSVDRLIALISAMGAYLDVRVSDTSPSEDAEVNRLIKMIATKNLDADRWGIAP
jgi:transcriptional regulator with XRE-family HTH domain